MGGWLRHRPGDVSLTARATTQECTQIGQNGLSAPFWSICVHYWAVGLGCGLPWDRNSVHKWEDRASPRRFGAFVYTVGLLRCCGQTWGRRSVHKSVEMASPCRFGAFVYTVATRVTIRIAMRAVSGGTSASATMACRRRLLAGPSRLVGKTNSERAAPLPGWHLGRGVNPHEPLKSPLSQCRPEGSQRQPGKSAIVNSSRASTPVFLWWAASESVTARTMPRWRFPPDRRPYPQTAHRRPAE